MKAPSRVNRGPAAAAENRAALIRAAREVFAHSGPHVPLARIWEAADVSPGVFYRHFSGRAALTRSLLEQDLEHLEALVAEPECTLDVLLARILDQLVGCAGLVATLAPDSEDVAASHARMHTLVADKLATGDHGSLGSDITADRLMLALALIGGLLTKTPERRRRRVAENSWQLLLSGLR
ncbi:TetR/AcrR family transcriptional regulator [Nocardia alni]|uniref:TetR/AcrR family transcriptional regulator n=1 Tax=Nocardia alni TaxID=2815723 RepID=UPI001C21313E|nr:helix-turn-helix domain-containing protein [Nocardia alni]